MNPEIKELWIAALESGEYKQGRGRLRTLDDKFCCLGVLCDLAVKAGIAEWRDGGDYRAVDCNSGILPPSIRAWSGVDSRNGILPGGGSLSELNDYGRMSFHGIAQVIREQF